MTRESSIVLSSFHPYFQCIDSRVGKGNRKNKIHCALSGSLTTMHTWFLLLSHNTRVIKFMVQVALQMWCWTQLPYDVRYTPLQLSLTWSEWCTWMSMEKNILWEVSVVDCVIHHPAITPPCPSHPLFAGLSLLSQSLCLSSSNLHLFCPSFPPLSSCLFVSLFLQFK